MSDKSRKRIITPNLSRQVKHSKTVEDLLASDDVNGILKDMNDLKPHISDMVVIYIDKRDGKWYSQITEHTLVSTAVWLLEAAKYTELIDPQENE